MSQRRIVKDERGAVMVAGVIMAASLSFGLWYLIGMGNAIVTRDRAQEVADSMAFSTAATHARGMNVVASQQKIMLGNFAATDAMLMVKDLTAACDQGVSICASTCSPYNSEGCYCESISPAVSAAANVSDQIASAAKQYMKGLMPVVGTLEKVIARMYGGEYAHTASTLAASKYESPGVLFTASQVSRSTASLFPDIGSFMNQAAPVYQAKYGLPVVDAKWANLNALVDPPAKKWVVSTYMSFAMVPATTVSGMAWAWGSAELANLASSGVQGYFGGPSAIAGYVQSYTNMDVRQIAAQAVNGVMPAIPVQSFPFRRESPTDLPSLHRMTQFGRMPKNIPLVNPDSAPSKTGAGGQALEMIARALVAKGYVVTPDVLATAGAEVAKGATKSITRAQEHYGPKLTATLAPLSTLAEGQLLAARVAKGDLTFGARPAFFSGSDTSYAGAQGGIGKIAYTEKDIKAVIGAMSGSVFKGVDDYAQRIRNPYTNAVNMLDGTVALPGDMYNGSPLSFAQASVPTSPERIRNMAASEDPSSGRTHADLLEGTLAANTCDSACQHACELQCDDVAKAQEGPRAKFSERQMCMSKCTRSRGKNEGKQATTERETPVGVMVSSSEFNCNCGGKWSDEKCNGQTDYSLALVQNCWEARLVPSTKDPRQAYWPTEGVADAARSAMTGNIDFLRNARVPEGMTDALSNGREKAKALFARAAQMPRIASGEEQSFLH